MQLVIDRQGVIRGVYAEVIDLTQLGDLAIQRASHVEPDSTGHWWADLAPVGGPKLGPFGRRSEALTAELTWLENYWGGEPRSDCARRVVTRRRIRLHFASYNTKTGGPAVGLTIHYNLRTTLTDRQSVRDLVTSLQLAAAGLPLGGSALSRSFGTSEADYDRAVATIRTAG